MRHLSSRVEWRDQRGVTLTELLVTLAISGMIMSGIILLWQKTQESYFQGSEAAELQGNVRVALDQIVREIRSTGHNPTSAVFNAVETANATTLEVRMDLNADGDATDANEHVTFAFDSANSRVTRDDGGGAQLLAEHVIANPDGTPVFQYWQRPISGGGQCGPEALVLSASPTAQCIRRVTVTLTAQTQAAGEPVKRTVQTDVDLRAR